MLEDMFIPKEVRCGHHIGCDHAVQGSNTPPDQPHDMQSVKAAPFGSLLSIVALYLAVVNDQASLCRRSSHLTIAVRRPQSRGRAVEGGGA